MERDALRSEVDQLRQRLADERQSSRVLQQELGTLKGQYAQSESQRDRLVTAMSDLRAQLEQLRHDVESLSAPPNGHGVVTDIIGDREFDVYANGRKFRVVASPDVSADDVRRGSEVLLNDNLTIIASLAADVVGEVVTVVDILEDGTRAVVSGRSDESQVVILSDQLRGTLLRRGDRCRMDSRAQLLLEKLPRPDLEDLLLEEVPDVCYSDIGGLDRQIEMIADAVELPFLHGQLFDEYQLRAPKGILLYGPPGCGKTLIAKAVANSLAKKVAQKLGDDKGRSYFMSIKGPELLNKYVGETERQIRLIFQRAREKSDEGWPVIIFFDEMDSMFRTRGTGVSSDMESTIVPQILAELDGVERLSNVIVIGATNREDLIDPAILRPGRLDVKIKIDRPTREGAAQIVRQYLNEQTPLADSERATGEPIDATIGRFISTAVEAMYDESAINEFLEVSYANGDREILYYKDFISGAMIESIVRRAKKSAIKRVITGEEGGLRADDLLSAVRAEFSENDDLPNTTNPDDWARVSGKKGERITFIRTIARSDNDGQSQSPKAVDQPVSGQYL